MRRLGKWVYGNLPLFVVLWLLMAAPTCLMQSDHGTFHFAKAHLCFGLLGAFCMASVFTWLCGLNKWIRYWVVGSVGFLTVVDFYLFVEFKTRITMRVVSLIAQTDSTEATEFIEHYIFTPTTMYVVVAVAVASFTIYWSTNKLRGRLYERVKEKVAGILFVCCNVLSVVLVIIGLTTSLLFHQIGFPTVEQLAYSLGQYLSISHDIEQLEQITANADGDIGEGQNVPDKIVWVIGESFNKHHSPLYGYPLPTTPNLSRAYDDGNLIVFSNTTTLSALTTIVMEQIFSTSEYADSVRWENHPLVITLLHNAGYKVRLHDNQIAAVRGDDKWDSENMWFLNSRLIESKSLDYWNDDVLAYDGEFVDRELKKSHDDYPMLSIFHLKGQHIPASMKYPAEFKRFDVEDYSWRTDLTDKEKAIVAAYDNATAYNDSVLSAIIRSLQGKDAILIYHSDHGEEVYDYRKHYGRTLEPVTPEIYRNIYEVPFMVYTTPEYRRKHPETYRRIEAARNREVSISDMSHTLLDIAGVRSRYYDPSRSIIKK